MDGARARWRSGPDARVRDPAACLSAAAHRLLYPEETMARRRLYDRGTRYWRVAHAGAGGRRHDAELRPCAELPDRAMERGAAGKYRDRSNGGADVLVLFRPPSWADASMGEESYGGGRRTGAARFHGQSDSIETPRRRSRRPPFPTLDYDRDPHCADVVVLLPGTADDCDREAERGRGQQPDQRARAVGRGRMLHPSMALFHPGRHAFARTRVASGHPGVAGRRFAGGAARLSLALLVRCRSRCGSAAVAVDGLASGGFRFGGFDRRGTTGSHCGLTIVRS